MKKLRYILSIRICRFLCVGGMSTLIDFIVYNMGLSQKLAVEIAKGISMLISSVFSYFANKLYTFENHAKTNIKYLMKFYMVFALNFAANIGTNSVLYGMTGEKIISFICATIAGMTVNYLGQKLFVFDKS